MRLLIIGGQSSELSSAAKMAMDRGVRVAFCPDPSSALDALRKGHGADLIMIDVRQDVGGLISTLENERIAIAVVACGVKTDADAAVAAIQAGAREYVPLPPDADLIAAILEAVADESSDMIAVDPAMKKVLALADQVGPSEASILITGESGVGKEVIAKYLHQKSKRAEKPFISINCAAIPDNLLESELFGHEKGAFTGAVARRIGKFEEANGGTLLLDEISEMDIRLQAKLLRAIQERTIDRVGSNKPVSVDIRILATSNRDLTQEVKAKTFREDLYFRLNVVNLHVPPLRKRQSDILALAEYFITKYAELNGVPKRALTEGAKRAAAACQWPGNVRELENTMHRAVLLAQGDTIDIDDIRLPTGDGPSVTSTDEQTQDGMVGKTVAQVEQDLILQTLDHCLGNRTHAANILGISIRTLRNKLKLYSDTGVAVPPPGIERAAS